MRDYRQLTQEEIQLLEQNVCWAEDWKRVMVDKDFRPYNFHRVIAYVFYKNAQLAPLPQGIDNYVRLLRGINIQNRFAAVMLAHIHILHAADGT